MIKITDYNPIFYFWFDIDINTKVICRETRNKEIDDSIKLIKRIDNESFHKIIKISLNFRARINYNSDMLFNHISIWKRDLTRQNISVQLKYDFIGLFINYSNIILEYVFKNSFSMTHHNPERVSRQLSEPFKVRLNMLAIMMNLMYDINYNNEIIFPLIFIEGLNITKINRWKELYEKSWINAPSLISNKNVNKVRLLMMIILSNIDTLIDSSDQYRTLINVEVLIRKLDKHIKKCLSNEIKILKEQIFISIDIKQDTKRQRL